MDYNLECVLESFKIFLQMFYNEYSKPDESNPEPEYKSQIDWITPRIHENKEKEDKEVKSLY